MSVVSEHPALGLWSYPGCIRDSGAFRKVSPTVTNQALTLPLEDLVLQRRRCIKPGFDTANVPATCEAPLSCEASGSKLSAKTSRGRNT